MAIRANALPIGEQDLSAVGPSIVARDSFKRAGFDATGRPEARFGSILSRELSQPQLEDDAIR
jgi:hypothetical protein